MSSGAIPAGFRPAAPDAPEALPEGFRPAAPDAPALDVGVPSLASGRLEFEAATIPEPGEAELALSFESQLGLPRDVALRNAAQARRMLRKARLDRAARGELADSRALSDAFRDPIAGAAVLKQLHEWLRLRRALHSRARSRAPSEQAAIGSELGRRSVRQGELLWGHIYGTETPEEAAEWARLKTAPPDREVPIGTVPPWMSPEEAQVYDRLARAHSEDRTGALAIAAGDVAQQWEILLASSAGGAAGAAIGGGLPLAAGVAFTAATGNPAGLAFAAEVAPIGAGLGARAGAGREMFRANTAETYAMLEDTVLKDGRMLPRDALVGFAVATGAIKTGLDLVGLEALLGTIGGSAVLRGPLAAVRRRVAALAGDRAALAAFAKFGAAYLAAIGSEVLTEDVQTALDFAARDASAAYAEGAGAAQVARAGAAGAASDEASLARAEARRAAATATAVFGAAGGLGAAAARRLAAHAEASRRERERLRAVEQAAAALTMRERAPASFRALAQRIGEEAGVDTAHMSPAELVELFQSEPGQAAIRGLSPRTLAEITEAARSGRDARIPMGEYLAAIAPLRAPTEVPGAAPAGLPGPNRPAGGALATARLDPRTLTETEEAQLLRDAAASPVATVGVETPPPVSPAVAGHFRRLRDAIVGAEHSPYDRRAADTLVAVIRAATLTRAARLGISVEEAIADEPALRFVGAAPRTALARPDLADAPVQDVTAARRLAELRAAIADLRGGKLPKLPQYPVLDLLKKLGGVHPDSVLAGELRAMDVTPKRFPGLFSRTARSVGDADTLVRSEHDVLEYLPAQPGTDYADRGAVLEAIRAELAGSPTRTAAEIAQLAEIEGARGELGALLGEAGVDLTQLDDEAAARALLAFEAQRFADEYFQVEEPEGGTDATLTPRREAKVVAEGGAVYRLADADERGRSAVSEGGPRAPVQVDLFDAAPEAAPAPKVSGPRGPRVALVRTGTLATGLTRVTTDEEVAHLVAPIRKDAQEQFLAVTTDAAGDVLRVVRVSRGLRDSSLVHPIETLAASFAVPNAAKVWVVHNHPSGNTGRSVEDQAVTDRLAGVLRGSGIELAGSLVVAPGGRASNVETEREFRIPPKRRDRVVAILERRLRRVAASVRERGGRVGSPEEALAWANERVPGETGLLLLDTRYVPAAWLSMSPDEMRRLRTGDPQRGIGAIARAVSDSNAGSMIAVFPDRAAIDRALTKNLGGFGRAFGVSFLDAVAPGFSARGEDFEGFRESGAQTFSQRRSQERGGTERGSITFSADMRDALIRFARSADLSTGLHELGHYYTLRLLDEAESPDAPEWVAKDAETLVRAALRATGRPADGPLAPLDTAGKEWLADAFLGYLREGRAPSADLRAAFARMREWLVSLYRSLRDLTGEAALPEDVRAVFDRLLATDDAIAAETREDVTASVFAREQLTEAERRTLEASIARSQASARERLDRAQLQEVAKRRGLFEKLERERKRREREALVEIRAEVDAEMAREPVWQADAYLRTGQLLGRETPADVPRVKLSRAAMLELFGADTPAGRAIQAVPTGARSWLTASKDGVHPDTVAEQFGFDRGADLVRALLAAGSVEAGSRERVAEARARERLAALGELGPGVLEELAAQAVTGEARIQFLLDEEAIAHAKGGSEPSPRRVVEDMARRMVAGKTLSELERGPRIHRETARAARREAWRAARAGDFARVSAELRRELLHTLVEQYAHEAQESVRSGLTKARRYERSPAVRKKIGLAGHGYLEMIDSRLEAVSLRVLSGAEILRRRTPFIEWLRQRLAAGDALAVPDLPLEADSAIWQEVPRWMLEGARTNYRELTFEEWQGFVQTLDSIANAARREYETTVQGEVIERETVRNTMAAEIRRGVLRPATRSPRLVAVPATLGSFARAVTTRSAEELGDHFWALGRRAQAAVTGVEALLSALVRSDTTSMLFQVLVHPFVAAEGQHADRMRSHVTPVRALADRFITSRGRSRYDEILPETRLRNRFARAGAGAPAWLTRRTLLGILLHMGNDSSLMKLTGGYDWFEGMELADQRAALAGILADHLDAEDFEFANRVWALLEGMRAEVFEHERRLSGIAPTPLEPVPFEAGGVKLTGGYFPALYDPTRSDAAALREAAEVFRREGTGVGKVEPTHYFTRSRTMLRSRALRLDAFAMLLDHLEDVSLDLSFREPILDAYKTLQGRELQEEIRAQLGHEFSVSQFWLPWLQAMSGDVGHAGGLREIEALARGMRARAGSFVLLARATTLAVQPTGLANGLQQLVENVEGRTVGTGTRHLVAARYLARGLFDALGQGSFARAQKTYREVMARSAMLRARTETFDREIKEIERRVAGRAGALSFVQHVGARAIAGVQLFAVDLPVWLASERLARDQGRSARDAAEVADSTVKLSQGSGSLVSQARLLTHGGTLAEIFTFMGTYLNTQLNQVSGSWRRHHSVPATAAAVLTAVTFPAILGFGLRQLIYAAFPGGPEPADEDEIPEKLGKEVLGSLFGLVPGVRDLWSTYSSGRVQAPGWLGVYWKEAANLGRAVDEALDEDDWGDLFWAALRSTALAKGVPADWPLQTAEGVVEDDETAARSRSGRSR